METPSGYSQTVSTTPPSFGDVSVIKIKSIYFAVIILVSCYNINTKKF